MKATRMPARTQISRWASMIGVTVVSACQSVAPANAPSSPDSSPPTPQPSVTTSGEPTALVSSMPSPGATAPATLGVLSGKIYDDQGLPLQGVTVQVRNTEFGINQQILAAGGAYVFNVPTGVPLLVIASKEGFGSRERRVQLPRSGRELELLQADFGGLSDGGAYGLSETPEIAAITPGNQLKDVESSPLEIHFRFSHPLDGTNQHRFENVLQIRFRLAGVDKILQIGTVFDNHVAAISWNASGTEATFRFDAPLVTRGAEAAAVSITFDTGIPIDEWPQATNGKRLGGDWAPETSDAAGVLVTQRIAPILKDLESVKFPSPRPSSANALWGQTHRISNTFTLARDTKAPTVVSVTGYRGLNGAEDRIDVLFDEPMRGYPIEMLDGSALKTANYRFLLGNLNTSDSTKEYEQGDPAKDGSVAGREPVFSANKNSLIHLYLPNGTFEGKTRLKLYVEPDVKDLAGNSLRPEIDPATGRPNNFLEGRII